MKLTKKWNRRVFAAVLGAVVAGMPLFAVHAEGPAFSPDGERYDVRRGMYEKEGGSDTHVRLGQYADEKHREQREEERREDLEKRQAEERKELEKQQAEERKEFEKNERQEEAKNVTKQDEAKNVTKQESEARPQGETREYKYDVRRGMYEKEGGSDTQVRRGMYEQPSEDGANRSLAR